MAASVWRVRDELWEAVHSLLPEHQPDPRGGRPALMTVSVSTRSCSSWSTGIAWRHLPTEMGCSPATAHRRLTAWQRAGVWQRLHQELLRALNAAGRIDWSAAVVDGSHIRALWGAPHWTLAGRPCPQWLKAPSTDRCERGSAGDQPDRRASQRRHSAAGVGRRCRAGARPAWPPAAARRASAGRPRI